MLCARQVPSEACTTMGIFTQLRPLTLASWAPPALRTLHLGQGMRLFSALSFASFSTQVLLIYQGMFM